MAPSELSISHRLEGTEYVRAGRPQLSDPAEATAVYGLLTQVFENSVAHSYLA